MSKNILPEMILSISPLISVFFVLKLSLIVDFQQEIHNLR